MSFPAWSWSPPQLLSESGKETDDDLAVHSSPAIAYPLTSSDDATSGLSCFLNGFLPAAAIRSFADQCTRKAIARDALQFRRKLPVQTEIRLSDFADWSAAISNRYEASVTRRTNSDTTHVGVEDLIEVFYARWLRVQMRCPRHAITLESTAAGEESRQRRCCHQTSQKKVKWSSFKDTKALALQAIPVKPIDTVGFIPRSNEKIGHSSAHTNLVPTLDDTLGGTSKILCHASAYLEPSVYVYGGLTPSGCSGGLWSLDLTNAHAWHRVDEGAGSANDNTRPSPRYNHTLISWKHFLVLFGGDRGPGHSDDLWYYDTLSQSWDRVSLEVEQRGLRPGARAGHSAVLFDNQMIIFGGWRGADGFSDVWSWDLKVRHWTLLSEHTPSRVGASGASPPSEDTEGDAPQPRHWHVAAVFGNHMYIHGGFGPWGPLAEVWKLDLAGSGGWAHVSTTGRIPQARCRHSGAAIDSERWAIIGGKDALGSYFDDLHILDTKTSVWQKILLFTPQHSPSTPDCQWWNCGQTVRQLPSLHCHSVCYHAATSTIVVTGGCDGDCTARDSTILLKRSPTATLLFEAWQRRRPRRARSGTLPDFISKHPNPYAFEICKFL